MGEVLAECLSLAVFGCMFDTPPMLTVEDSLDVYEYQYLDSTKHT